ncbi:hypothetical protein AB3S75_000680 [Citrus x aurantiifolia]
MDPQGNSPAEDIKELVINGINMFATTSGKKRVHSEFKIVQVPKQPGSYERGYCVMLCMRDIIVDPSLLLNNFNNKSIYTQAEMGEVRYEWMNYVRVLI